MNEKRKELFHLLEENQAAFEAVCKNFSPSQMTHKPQEEVWSIQEVVEHIALSEKAFYDVSMYALNKPATTAEAIGQKSSDNYIRKGNLNREFKVKAPDVAAPKGNISVEDSLVFFQEYRNKVKDLVQNSSADWEAHFWKHPFWGYIDLNKTILNTCGHLNRHLGQIDEISKSEGFPNS